MVIEDNSNEIVTDNISGIAVASDMSESTDSGASEAIVEDGAISDTEKEEEKEEARKRAAQRGTIIQEDFRMKMHNW